MILKIGIPLLLFLSSLQANQDTDRGLAGLRDVRYRHFLEAPRSVSYSSSSRTKRSAIFRTGVKVCPQETAKAVISSHRAYYKLRVCQEAIWEAFRVFFDRVPNSEEYMSWVHTCQHENLCMDDLARNFSSSPEHLDMVARRVAELADSEGALTKTPEPDKDCPWTAQNGIIPTEPAVILEEANLIPENQQQWIVEFSVTVEDPLYSEILRDPATPEYADVVRELRDKMYHVFAKIPGFKEIQLLGFRAEDVSVRYAVLFNGDTELSDQPEGYLSTDVETQQDMTAPKLQNIIVRALKQDHSLPLDLNTLSFDAVYEVEDHVSKIAPTAEPPVEESSSVAMAASKLSEDSSISTETHTIMTLIPEVLTDVIWVEPEQTPVHPAGDAVTQVEPLPPTEEDGFFAETPVTEPGVVVHLFSDYTPTQATEIQATEIQTTVPTDLDLTIQHDKGRDTNMETAAAEEESSGESSPESPLTATVPDSTHSEGGAVPSESIPTEGDSVSSESTPTEGDNEGDSVFPTVLESTLTEGDSVSPDTVPESTLTEGDSVSPDTVPESTLTEGDSVSSESTPTEGDNEGDSVSPTVLESTLTEGDSVSPDTVPESTLTEGDSVSSASTPTEGDTEGVSVSPDTVFESTLTEGHSVSPTVPESTPTEGNTVPPDTVPESTPTEGNNVPPDTVPESTPLEGNNLPLDTVPVSTLTEGDGVPPDTVPESTLTEGDGVPPDTVPESTLTEGDDVSHEHPHSTLTEGESGLASESTPTEGESGSGLSSDADRGLYEWTSAPAMRQASTPLMAAVERSKDLVVFFRLRVSNMMFTDNLFNKDSAEYKSLENTFLELLLPYLATNLTGFKALEILSFQNGSVIVNSKMKLNKAVPYNVTEAVHCVLEDFCNSASSQLDIQVDSRSLEIEPADEPDPCQSITCSEFSRCMINGWSGEAECVCDPGYSAVDGQPCQSLCSLEPDFCLNGGLCQNIPGHGATCRCPVGKYWHYHGERCDELITLPLDTTVILTGLVGSLCLVGAVIGILIFINKKCIRPQKAVTVVHTVAPYAFDDTLRVNPVFQNDDELISQVSTLPYPSSSVSSQSQASEQEHFASVENIHLSSEIPRQLYTTRSKKLITDMMDIHHCMPHSQTWRPQIPGTTYCVLRASENDCVEVTVV